MSKLLYHGSENIELAKEWACAKQNNGYANIYEFEMDGLEIINLNSPEYNILNWLAILADNRTYWQNGIISLQKLSEAMRLGKLGEQIVLKSPKAFEQIKFIGCEEVDAGEYFNKKREREREARREYRRNKSETANVNDLFILDIMREEIRNGDARLSV